MGNAIRGRMRRDRRPDELPSRSGGSTHRPYRLCCQRVSVLVIGRTALEWAEDSWRWQQPGAMRLAGAGFTRRPSGCAPVRWVYALVGYRPNFGNSALDAAILRRAPVREALRGNFSRITRPL